MNSQNTLPAVAALALAFLFPIYWGIALYSGNIEGDFSAYFKHDMQAFTPIDMLFVIIGLLEMYIYFSLAKSLQEQLNTKTLYILLMIMVATCGLFHATVLVDVWFSLFGTGMSIISIENVIAATQYIAVIALGLATILTFVCSIVMLSKFAQLPSMLKVLSVLLLVLSVFQMTVILSAFNLLLFPCILILLSVYFFKDPETLEVI